jgi:protein TonB
VRDLIPVVVANDKAPEESQVPNQKDLIDTAPGLVTQAGEPGADPNTNLDDLRHGSGGDGGDVVADAVAKPEVYTYVEQMPQLPGGGGQAAIVAAIQKAVKYPNIDLRNGVEGRVYASFTVNSKGEVVDLKVVKGLSSTLDEETLRAIKTLPKFIPGKQNGREVNVSFTVPITFKIQ